MKWDKRHWGLDEDEFEIEAKASTYSWWVWLIFVAYFLFGGQYCGS
jgi:hypothetical protein